ncbi:molybdopterin-dependent oxidoreductase [Kitasatospora sp. NPDC051170]|uniref:molybdopterin-dependent oxidoreductase n=1 Tax=Kitasatospora sp. NPDC051170 TaxID=3364056 RepID=UPI0037AB5B98
MGYHNDPETPDVFRTPIGQVFVRTHLGEAPAIEAADWTLTVDGLVERPLEIGLSALLELPQTRVTSVHECLGNPLNPDVPTRAVANLEWTGVALSAVLALAGPSAGARHLWLEGADTGSFAGESGLTYLKDLPLEEGGAAVLLAHRVNGEPLPRQHGFPVRAVVPGMFGTNSVKWLRRITLAAERPEHLFTTRLYTRAVPGSEERVPAREIDVSSKLLTPRDGARVPAGVCELAGRAWSSTEVTSVEVSVDDGPWRPAVLEPRGAQPAWQRFALDHDLAPGPHRVRARATDAVGRVQPLAGTRNHVHEIRLTAGTEHEHE